MENNEKVVVNLHIYLALSKEEKALAWIADEDPEAKTILVSIEDVEVNMQGFQYQETIPLVDLISRGDLTRWIQERRNLHGCERAERTLKIDECQQLKEVLKYFDTCPDRLIVNVKRSWVSIKEEFVKKQAEKIHEWFIEWNP